MKKKKEKKKTLTPNEKGEGLQIQTTIKCEKVKWLVDVKDH